MRLFYVGGIAVANTKIKLTTLLEFLRQETDMDHPATTNQIIKRMVEQI